jgi:hypothetical protein
LSNWTVIAGDELGAFVRHRTHHREPLAPLPPIDVADAPLDERRELIGCSAGEAVSASALKGP